MADSCFENACSRSKILLNLRTHSSRSVVDPGFSRDLHSSDLIRKIINPFEFTHNTLSMTTTFTEGIDLQNQMNDGAHFNLFKQVKRLESNC